METLAIIAYKQPITRVEIEEIRGVGADVMIRKLEARGLIKEEGRPDLPEFNKDNNDDLFHS